jgi:hypothetical protein
MPYPGSLRANQGGWAPQIIDEQVAGADHAVVTGNQDVVWVGAEVVTVISYGVADEETKRSG